MTIPKPTELLIGYMNSGAFNMATKSETPITQGIIKYLKANKGDGYHVHGSALQRGAEPDISGEICVEGIWRHLKLEVKTETGEPSKRQLYRLKQYHQRGYFAGVITGIPDLQRLIRAYEVWMSHNKRYDFSQHDLPYAKDIYYDDATN